MEKQVIKSLDNVDIWNFESTNSLQTKQFGLAPIGVGTYLSVFISNNRHDDLQMRLYIIRSREQNTGLKRGGNAGAQESQPSII